MYRLSDSRDGGGMYRLGVGIGFSGWRRFPRGELLMGRREGTLVRKFSGTMWLSKGKSLLFSVKCRSGIGPSGMGRSVKCRLGMGQSGMGQAGGRRHGDGAKRDGVIMKGQSSGNHRVIVGAIMEWGRGRGRTVEISRRIGRCFGGKYRYGANREWASNAVSRRPDGG